MWKKCRRCGAYKLRTDFYPRKTGTDGHMSWCKSCVCEYRNLRRQGVSTAEQQRQWKKDNPKRTMIHRAAKRAKMLGLEFDLSVVDIEIPHVCPILGIELQVGEAYGQFDSPSLDRIDNTQGYVRGNVQVISYRANRMKNDATPEELKSFAAWVLEVYGA